MEYVYAALMLHKLGKTINEQNLAKVIESIGVQVDDAKVKTLLASLKDVDIEKELEKAQVAAIVPAGGESKAEAKEEKKEEVKTEAAAEGLSALFG